MTFTLPTLPFDLTNALLWAVPAGLLWYWLRGELTPKRFLSIWESDGVLSTRLLGATALLIFGMCMYAAGRMDDNGLGQLLGWVAAFFAVGAVPKAASALSTPTTVNAKNVKADVTAGTVVVDNSNAQGAQPE